MPSVEFVSSHDVRAARHLLRENLTGREPLFSTPADRHVFGDVQDPEFELIAVGPASEGGAGPIRWRTPSKSRTLRGSITPSDAGAARLTATFVGPSLPSSRRRRTEAWLLEWLRRVLEARA